MSIIELLISGQTVHLFLFCCCQHLFDITAKMKLVYNFDSAVC